MSSRFLAIYVSSLPAPELSGSILDKHDSHADLYVSAATYVLWTNLLGR